MGNNHDKYFGKQKRKILLLGIEKSGKTTLLNAIVSAQIKKNIQPTKDLNIQDCKIGSLTITYFDLAGGERQRVFWKQHYEGTQGIVFLIDPNSQQQISIKQLTKILLINQLKQIPFAVGISKTDIAQKQRIQNVIKEINQLFKQYKHTHQTFKLSYKNRNSYQQLMKWLLSQTKPL